MTHLLLVLTMGVVSLVALVVFLGGLEGTVSVPPAGGTLQVVYLSVFVLLVVAALLVWVVGQIRSVSGAMRALQGKPAHASWRKRHSVSGTLTNPPSASLNAACQGSTGECPRERASKQDVRQFAGATLVEWDRRVW